MSTIQVKQPKKATPVQNQYEKNPYEQGHVQNDTNPVASFGKDVASNINKTFGTGLLDTLLNQTPSERRPSFEKKDPFQRPAIRVERTIFDYKRYAETERRPTEIKQLIEVIRQEMKSVKMAGEALSSEMNEIDKLTLENISASPDVYHVRFLEVILSLLRTLKMKINESRTWLNAAKGRSGKRGGAFASRSKSKGTAYSMSQELSNARSIQ